MLNKLSIHNYALINQIDIDFKDGLSVITGETGAGKSIILGALSMILGGRADTKSIGNADKKSIIEATFYAKNDAEIAVEHYDNKQQEEAWLKIFNLFRKHQENRSDVVNAGRVLNMDSTQLYELFGIIESECDKRELVKCSDWGYVKNTYL